MLCKCRVRGIYKRILFIFFQVVDTSTAMYSFRYSSSHLSLVFFLFSFETRRLRGDTSLRPEPLRIPPLEDIEFLDDIHIKKQNMRFKSLTNDQTVLILTSTRDTRSMEKDFPRRCLVWKLFRRIRNQISAHAQKSVKCPWTVSWLLKKLKLLNLMRART